MWTYSWIIVVKDSNKKVILSTILHFLHSLTFTHSSILGMVFIIIVYLIHVQLIVYIRPAWEAFPGSILLTNVTFYWK